jgi:hypothetical protein
MLKSCEWQDTVDLTLNIYPLKTLYLRLIMVENQHF